MSVLEAISKRHNMSAGMSGISLPELVKETGMNYPEIKQEVNRLYREEKITIHPGVNQKLIYIKPPKHVLQNKTNL